MIELGMLTKLLTWVSAAAGAAETVKGFWPKKWTNVEVRFAVEEIGLGFSCDDKSQGWFRVTVLDPGLEKVAYMEAANADNARPKVAINVKKFPPDLLREMFQMARCMREFERTEDTVFATKFQSHRNRVLFLWAHPSAEDPERKEVEEKVINIVAAVLVDVEKSHITLESALREDLGAEGLDLYDIAALVEDEFRIELTDNDLGVVEHDSGWGCSSVCGSSLDSSDWGPLWVTVEDIVDCVWSKLKS